MHREKKFFAHISFPAWRKNLYFAGINIGGGTNLFLNLFNFVFLKDELRW